MEVTCNDIGKEWNRVLKNEWDASPQVLCVNYPTIWFRLQLLIYIEFSFVDLFITYLKMNVPIFRWNRKRKMLNLKNYLEFLQIILEQCAWVSSDFVTSRSFILNLFRTTTRKVHTRHNDEISFETHDGGS